jgi:HEPN domain-containing protein
MPDPPPEGLGFHAQQCVEKALKAFLTAFSIPFERRHDLNYLLALCVSVDPAFAQFHADADTLTPYAVEFRYPDALTDLVLADALDATETAQRLYVFIVAHLQ